MQQGYSLIQLSLVFTVLSLLLVAMLPMSGATTLASGNSAQHMNALLLAMRQYEAANGSLPCPADATLPLGNALYGIAASGGGTSGGCSGGSPAANFTDSTHNVAIGMVPVRTLGLSAQDAFDSFGRFITYAVDTHATTCFSGTLNGTLTVTDNGLPLNSVAVLVSHGIDGHGAFLPYAGGSGSGVRLNAGSQDADELTNAHVDASFAPLTVLNNFVRKTPTDTFHNLLVYANPTWNLNTVPAASAAVLMPQITTPAAGTYIAGQTLFFTLTYPSAVTVTGSPRLVLTIGANTRYAAYASGSGGKSLVFGYTLAAADYAPQGISLSPAIDLNGGAITGSAAAQPCAVFTQPALGNVLVKKLVMYVSDWNNNRVEKFDAYGNYLFQFGAYGLLGGLFSHPGQLAVDGSANIYVSDYGNSRVEKFNSSGTFVSALGSLGILGGQFLNPGAIAFDSAGNIWIDDTGNSRVEEFSAAGSYLGTFGSAGIWNGQFLVTSGLAIDASGNFWVGDAGNNRLEQFSASGSYLMQTGGYGSAAGKLSGPCGHAIDASGTIWVADSHNNRVEAFSAGGVYSGQFGSYGSGNGQLSLPCGIAADVAGNLWVVDGGNNRVEKFSGSGGYVSQFGSYGSGNGQFSLPSGIALAYE